MAGSLHGSARTTPRVRAELQASEETTGTLAQRFGLSRTTVNKWRSPTTEVAPFLWTVCRLAGYGSVRAASLSVS